MYSEKDMDDYSEYMNVIRGLIRDSNLIPKAKADMIMSPTLQKTNDAEWYLEYIDTNGIIHTFAFASFRQWQLQESRDKKLNQLL
jgi:hypothetical protein